MIERALVEFLLSAVSVLLVAQFLPGIKAKNFVAALWFSLMVSLVSGFFSVVLWVLFPIKWLFGGVIARFFGRGFIFLVAAQLSNGIEVDGCVMASVGALLVTVITSGALQLIFH
jgi:putative membrane protein